ncbi:hypothetical protein PQE20_27390 (plasmid) [Vibrio harveyi]|uniref:hypothetical protein n=1 Tax=Vibrio harveyi TaxID=669 RepID=UPI00234DC293|nr:hypothetical protein [Vibrio harveyi]WCP84205.1 hypothetical protein PQE20_27390 [Vibrio harveyi]
MDYKQLLEHVIKPANNLLGVDSLAAQQLLIGTCAVESNADFIAQIGNGPARGIFQMEPATHKDIWLNYLKYRDVYRETAGDLLSGMEFDYMTHTKGSDEGFDMIANQSLTSNLLYQAVMCRIHYLRVKEPLPPANDIEALGAYWKKHYNTHLGSGTVKKFIDAFPGYLWE